MSDKKNIKTFEDFQKKKEEQLSKKAEIKEMEEVDEEEVHYPEIFAHDEPAWIITH